MEKEITIENLQQENAELKIKVEANEAEITRLNAELESEKNTRKVYEDMYFEQTQRANKCETFLRTISMMLDVASNEESSTSTAARFDLMKGTIDKFLKP